MTVLAEGDQTRGTEPAGRLSPSQDPTSSALARLQAEWRAPPVSPSGNSTGRRKSTHTALVKSNRVLGTAETSCQPPTSSLMGVSGIR